VSGQTRIMPKYDIYIDYTGCNTVLKCTKLHIIVQCSSLLYKAVLGYIDIFWQKSTNCDLFFVFLGLTF